jgi:competence protein ComEC
LHSFSFSWLSRVEVTPFCITISYTEFRTYHGSGTSSSAAFLQAVRPTVGIFQVGHRNRYRHPQKLVYARYGAMGIERIRTDERGAVTMAFGPGLDVTTYRATHARYWYGR